MSRLTLKTIKKLAELNCVKPIGNKRKLQTWLDALYTIERHYGDLEFLEDVNIDVQINTVNLGNYSKEYELYLDGWIEGVDQVWDEEEGQYVEVTETEENDRLVEPTATTNDYSNLTVKQLTQICRSDKKKYKSYSRLRKAELIAHIEKCDDEIVKKAFVIIPSRSQEKSSLDMKLDAIREKQAAYKAASNEQGFVGYTCPEDMFQWYRVYEDGRQVAVEIDEIIYGEQIIEDCITGDCVDTDYLQECYEDHLRYQAEEKVITRNGALPYVHNLRQLLGLDTKVFDRIVSYLDLEQGNMATGKFYILVWDTYSNYQENRDEYLERGSYSVYHELKETNEYVANNEPFTDYMYYHQNEPNSEVATQPYVLWLEQQKREIEDARERLENSLHQPVVTIDDDEDLPF